MITLNQQRKQWLVIALILLIPCLWIAEIGKSRALLAAEKQKGFSFAAWWQGLYSSPDADQALTEVADDGANWISLIVTQYQDTIDSTTIYATTATPTDEDLLHAISQAHSLGMKVMLKPHVDLANDPTHWRGEIGIGFSEADWIAWFISYHSFINHYAQLAQAAGVEQFCVGTELISTQFRLADWQSVIVEVRGLFSGPIAYATSQGSEGSISWWDKVDFIGVDAYYELTDKNDPTLEELKAAWVPLTASLKTLSENWSKPILFTEIGYRSQDGANRHPWDYQSGGTVDLQEQEDLYQAVFESVFNQDWFAGMFWWSWDPDPLQGGPCDMGYSPHDKPAEGVLRRWYGASTKFEQFPGLNTKRTSAVYTDSLGMGWDDWSWWGYYNFVFTESVASGAYAISADAQGWGAIALHYNNFDTTPYYWLELYVYKTSGAVSLVVFANDENDQSLRTRPVEDCRYTEGQPIAPGVWTRVRIPLNDLNASHRLLQRLSIENYSAQPFTFYVDDVRLVGVLWKNILPLVWKP